MSSRKTKEEMKQLFDAFCEQIAYILRTGTSNRTEKVKNAISLGGRSITDFQNDIISAVQKHIEDPKAHNLRAENFDMPTQAELDSLTANAIPSGVLPLSIFDVRDAKAISAAYFWRAKYSLNGYIDMPKASIMFNGAPMMPSNSIVTFDNGDVDNYVYLEILTDNTRGILRTRPEKLPDTYSRMYLFKIPAKIWTHDELRAQIKTIVRIGTHRFSSVPIGQGIPYYLSEDGKKAWIS